MMQATVPDPSQFEFMLIKMIGEPISDALLPSCHCWVHPYSVIPMKIGVQMGPVLMINCREGGMFLKLE